MKMPNVLRHLQNNTTLLHENVIENKFPINLSESHTANTVPLLLLFGIAKCWRIYLDVVPFSYQKPGCFLFPLAIQYNAITGHLLEKLIFVSLVHADRHHRLVCRA